MLVKRYKPGFFKIQIQHVRKCAVCDYSPSITNLQCPIYESCYKANYVPEEYFEMNLLSAGYFKLPPYYIPKGHLLPKYKEYENKTNI